MNIEDFNKKTLKTSEQACKLITAMIDIYIPNAESEEAILDFFEILTDDLKQNKKLNYITFMMFFEKYKVNEKNFKYYTQYITENASKEIIMQSNPEWNWEEKPFEFNSLKDLLATLQTSIYFKPAGEKEAETLSETVHKKLKKGIDFIHQNNDNFAKFLKINKNKTIKTLIKKDFLKNLLEYNYEEYKNFCEFHQINHVKLLKQIYDGDYYGITRILSPISYRADFTMELENILQDVTQEKDFFVSDVEEYKISQFIENGMPGRHHCSIALMEYIVENKFDLALVLYKYFKEPILEGLNNLAVKKYYDPNEKYNENTVFDHLHPLLLKRVQIILHSQSNSGEYHQFSQLTVKEINHFENYMNQMKNNNKLKM